MQAMLWLVQRTEANARELVKRLGAAMPPEPFSAACVMLAAHAFGDEISNAQRADKRDLAADLLEASETAARPSEAERGGAARPDPGLIRLWVEE